MHVDEMVLVLRQLYPDANHVYDVRVDVINGTPILATWSLPTPQPTPAELEAALPAALARAEALRELSEAQALLDERYRMYTRALATGNADAASEIQSEIADILAYLKELRDAS